MKYLAIIPFLFIASHSFATIITPLDSDALSSQEKADETAKIINSNFQELWNNKINISTNGLTSANYFVSDLLDSESSDYNAFVIMENSDDLWRSKQTKNSGEPGARSYQITDLLNPENQEQNINLINLIFYELDDAKEDF